MKIGMRKPSIKKSFKARTTGRVKRSFKKKVFPLYGKKGMGWIKNPKKALYNKIYKKTTFSITDIFKGIRKISDSDNNNKGFNNRKIKTAIVMGGSLLALVVVFGAALGGKDSGETVRNSEAEPTAAVERFSPDEFTRAEDLTVETTSEGTAPATVTEAAAETVAQTAAATTSATATTAVPVPSPVPAAQQTTVLVNTTAPAETYDEEAEHDYILNTNTKKFHRPGCSSVREMKDKNKQTFHGTRDEVIEYGYEPCGRCRP
ncbi:MAG: hypothetical protein J5562_05705 [Clostridia bacterium]|nr:hypothetical protein [Clostridia bacterium]